MKLRLVPRADGQCDIYLRFTGSTIYETNSRSLEGWPVILTVLCFKKVSFPIYVICSTDSYAYV